MKPTSIMKYNRTIMRTTVTNFKQLLNYRETILGGLVVVPFRMKELTTVHCPLEIQEFFSSEYFRRKSSHPTHIALSGVWEQIAKVSKTVILKFINSTLLIVPIAVTITMIKLGR